MKVKFLGLVFVLILLAMLGGAMAVSASDGVDAVQQGQVIIVDHNCTDLSNVPDYWMEQVQTQLNIYYGHTSHGSQPVSGMNALGIPMPPLHEYGDDLGHNGDTSWVQPTRDYLDSHPETNVVVWSWCGGASDNTEEGINIYLNAMNQLEMDYPNVAFVYMTGHLDGGGVEGNLHARNNQIRDYCVTNGKILFDFADIESYDPDEDEFLSRYALDTCYYDGDGDGNPWNDDTNWAIEWCDEHPGDILCEEIGCAHSEALNCHMKGRAFWWMLARIAGWQGIGQGMSQKMASPETATRGETITYTVVIRDLTAPLTATVYMTDQVPVGLSYVSGTLTATAGTVIEAGAPILRWSGVLTPAPAVTVTYAVAVVAAAPQVITNTAAIVAPGYQSLTRTASVTITPPPGWPDLTPSFKEASRHSANYGDHVTYTVVLRNANGPMTRTVFFTDVIPDGLLYVSETLTATTGVVSDTMAPALYWSGVLTPTPVVTITYAVAVSETESQLIENAAVIVVPDYQVLTRTAGVLINGRRFYLPLVLKEQ